MAYRSKLSGTTLDIFDVGLTAPFTIDASGLTAQRTWKIPDSDGAPGYVLTTDGFSNLSWSAVGSAADQTTPYYIPTGISFTVNLYKQNLFNLPITIDGAIIINGALVQV